ncbi:DJ-1/PfpI family protein [Alkalicoccobacillus porphyridii]|uniref:DJ-1/PfpI family protein n=1 Tax=Alkalicoccobacillus porphyridii TaxID=2597270 RepID=A0A553ZX65_9BACI|nr:DJ-1/PfpI family protein [Alkalicoccobacillus porphyridii]TSB45936.1 DJ-1/PfpI family protein [Alkalicoccobacillus porphyridii]
MQRNYHVGILLFDYVDALDFSGPYEVFNLTTFNESDVMKLFTNTLDKKPFKVSTISHYGKQITVHNGLKVLPDYSLANAPTFDIIIVPGGPLKAIKLVEKNQEIINWIAGYKDKLVASVCTGAFFLAKAGLLHGKKATTNRSALDLLNIRYPYIEVIRGTKYVDEGNIITSAGVSAGIQMALHVVRKLFDEETARRTAHTIELD